MSGFLYVVAIGVPISAVLCLLHSAVFRRDVVMGGLPVVGSLVAMGLILVVLFG
jgi:hypothetical protein